MAICIRCGNKWKMTAFSSCPVCKEKWEKARDKAYDKTVRNKESAKVYHSKEWEAVRIQAIIRDGFKCVKCGVPIKRKPRDHAVDHIKEITEGGEKYDLDNLQTLCTKCHNRKRIGCSQKG